MKTIFKLRLRSLRRKHAAPANLKKGSADLHNSCRLAQPKELVIVEVAVFLLTAQALAINWLAGLPYPVWREQNRKGRAF
jgi:hypothetical protein